MSQFGKFQLLEQIGGGRLSQVFRVTRLGADRARPPEIALKRVRPDVISEPAFVHLVAREAGLLTRLSHVNLCQCQEVGVIDGSAFLTLDLVDGCTLRALLRRVSGLGARLPSTSIIAIAYQLARVLHYLHEECDAHLIHLDLSPQNVMIDRTGALKLIDFGIARQLDGENPPPLDGKIAGTVGYMSPEQARGQELDTRADQYGLGILMWEMLAARRAFRGNTKETWDRMRAGQIPDAVSALGPSHADLARAILQLLDPTPEDRFPHMQAVLRRLESIREPLKGLRPLAALVHRFMEDPAFDPFDVVKPQRPDPRVPGDLPRGDVSDEGYEELSIEVDHGAGTPGSLVRAALPSKGVPDSIFLETIGEAKATAEMAR